MDALIAALRASEHEGIDPEVYGVSLLEQRRKEAGSGFLSRKGFEPEAAATMDTWLTYLYLKFASDLADGVSDLAHADPAWQITPDSFDPVDHLERALRDNHIAESLSELTPADEEYKRLRKALAEYRAGAAKGGWPASARGQAEARARRHLQFTLSRSGSRPHTTWLAKPPLLTAQPFTIPACRTRSNISSAGTG